MDTRRLIKKKFLRLFSILSIGSLAVFIPASAIAQSGDTNGEWPSYAADAGSTKYTDLTQIRAENFDQLKIAWRWQSIDGDLDFEALLGDGAEVNFSRLQATPLMIDGVMYTLTALNQIVALDAASGELIWSFDPQVYLSGPSNSPLGFHHRGVAWWSEDGESRVLTSDSK